MFYSLKSNKNFFNAGLENGFTTIFSTSNFGGKDSNTGQADRLRDPLDSIANTSNMKKKQKREKRKKHKTSKTTKSRKRERSKRSPSSSSVSTSSSSPPSSKPTKKRSRDFPPKPKDADSTVPLDCLLHKRNLLAEIAVNCLDAGKLASMIPFCLIDRTKEELIQKVTEELEVMSKKRILAALEGKEASSSSESEESEQEFKPEEKGQSHSPEVNTPKTHDSNDRVSLTEETTPPQCSLEEGEIIDGAD
ncbi:unnamed protein product, partial [Mesorhabditis belari]|uniref:Uncharacterized protein n=1 Tax=Mesorhabditis belari TaxID=2138241 RepID=A0AAF3EJF5_9BILA